MVQIIRPSYYVYNGSACIILELIQKKKSSFWCYVYIVNSDKK